MNILTESSFLNKTKNSTKNIIGIGALSLAFALSGCQSTNVEPLVDLKTQTFISPMQTAASLANKITNKNIKNILENRISGVYQHPVYQDQIITYQFDNDKNSEKNIKKDLEKLGLSSKYFDTENSIYKLISNSKSSRHIQNPLGNKETDINLCKITESNYLNPPRITSGKPNDSSAFEMFTTIPLTDKQLHRGVNLLYHEAAHSLKHQQMGVLDFLTMPFSKKTLIKLENSSAVFGEIMTLKFISKTSGKLKIKHSEDFLQGQTEIALSAAKLKTGTHNDEDTHQIIPITTLLQKIHQLDHNYAANLEIKHIENLSNILSQNAVDTNYIDVYNETMHKENNEMTNLFIDKIVNAPINEIIAYKKILNISIKNNDFPNQERKHSATMYNLITNMVIKDYNNLNNKSLKTSDFKEKVSNKMILDIDELKVDDFNYNHLIAKINFKSESSNQNKLFDKIITLIADNNIPLPQIRNKKNLKLN